jgi:sugar phosphate isomerase/epimerase
MRLAYSTLGCPQWTVEEAVAAAVRYGYDAIEWRMADGAIIEPDTPVSVRRRLREIPAANGIAIAHVHVKDGRPSASSPGTWKLCLLNEGMVPLREACSALRHSGYDGYLSLEWEKQWHPEIAEPRIALPQAVPLLRRFWQED